MQTLIDPFEVNAPYVPPPMRGPMATLSVDVEVEFARPAPVGEKDDAPDSWRRVRCWCSED